MNQMNNQSFMHVISSFFGEHSYISIISSVLGLSTNYIKTLSPIISFIILLCTLIVVVLTVSDRIEKRIEKQRVKKKSKNIRT